MMIIQQRVDYLTKRRDITNTIFEALFIPIDCIHFFLHQFNVTIDI